MAYQSHAIPALAMAPSTPGLMILPSEIQAGESFTLFRQFAQLLKRAYSQDSLEFFAATQDLVVVPHSDVNEDKVCYSVKFFNWDSNQRDEWVQRTLARFASVCTKRRVSGNRLTFVSSLVDVEPTVGPAYKELKLVLSTSVFFNDYRVTCGFPCTDEERSMQAQIIQQFLENQLFEMYGDNGTFAEVTEVRVGPNDAIAPKL